MTFDENPMTLFLTKDFPSVTLRDIYSVIAYYLQHSREVQEYLREQGQVAAEVRSEIERNLEPAELRERLRLRRAGTAA